MPRTTTTRSWHHLVSRKLVAARAAATQLIEAMSRTVLDLLVSQPAGSPVPPEEMLFEPHLLARGSTTQVA